jgi:hypothetical protein
MKDGRAAKRKEIESQSQDFWRRLEKKIDEAGITKEYEFLNSFVSRDQVCVVIKRGLMGDLTGTYIWMMFPLLNIGTNKLSNAIAIEAFNTQDNTAENKKQQNSSENAASETEEENSQTIDEQKPAATGATYFFRTIGRKEYAQTKDEDLIIELENIVKNINHAISHQSSRTPRHNHPGHNTLCSRTAATSFFTIPLIRRLLLAEGFRANSYIA